MIRVKGYQFSNGMTLRSFDPVSTTDDLMVRRFKEAGAIIVGTTVMTEYGRCPLGYNSHYKGRLTRRVELLHCFALLPAGSRNLAFLCQDLSIHTMKDATRGDPPPVAFVQVRYFLVVQCWRLLMLRC